MKKKKTFTSMAIFIATLILGVGYAAVSDITLNLNGTANVKANADFNVQYDTTHEVGLSTENTVVWDDDTTHDVVAGNYENTLTANMTVYLDSTNRTAYAIYKIDNKSAELNTTIASEVTSDFDTEYTDYLSLEQALYANEDCTTPLNGTELAPNESAYLKVTVSLTKLPVDDIVDASFAVALNASPVEVSLGD